jgi:hypothetical protein
VNVLPLAAGDAEMTRVLDLRRSDDAVVPSEVSLGSIPALVYSPGPLLEGHCRGASAKRYRWSVPACARAKNERVVGM